MITFVIFVSALLMSLAVSFNIQHEEVNTLPKLPIYVGIGYNLATGNPLGHSVDTGFAYPIFKMTYKNQQTTSDNRYLVPDGIANRLVSSCSFSTSVSTYRGTQSYIKEMMSKVTAKAGMSAVVYEASFSVSKTTKSMQEATSKQKKSVTHASAECEAYYLSVDIFKQLSLEDSFQNAVNVSYHNNNWENFIEEYGTHFVENVNMGGRAVQEIQYSYESVSQLNSLDTDIAIAAKARYAEFFADAEWDWHKHIQQINYTEMFSKDTTELYLGGKPPRDGNVHTWVSAVLSNPMPIKYSVLELTELFDKITIPDIKTNLSKVKTSFTTALGLYCTKMGCKKPTPDLPNPPHSKTQLHQVQSYGGSGGGPYDFSLTAPLVNLVKFTIRCNKNIDGIQALFSDGVTSTYSPYKGGNGGSPHDWQLPKGQYLNQVEYWSSTLVNGLTFITNKGTKSPLWGQKSGTYNIVTFPSGYRVAGIYGRSGQSLDKLGFTLARTVIPSSQGQQWQTETKTIEIRAQ